MHIIYIQHAHHPMNTCRADTLSWYPGAQRYRSVGELLSARQASGWPPEERAWRDRPEDETLPDDTHSRALPRGSPPVSDHRSSGASEHREARVVRAADPSRSDRAD